MRAPSKKASALISYANTPGIIATLVSARLASLVELQTVLGPYDAYRLLEIHMIDQHNQGVLNGNS